MNIKKVFKIIVMIVFIFYASLSLAQGDSAQLINTLSRNPKIIEPELVLKDFKEGKPTTRVIVNLSKPAWFEENRNFKDLSFRKKLQEAVRVAQNHVISRLDPKKVQITNKFVYIFGFSAEVTLEGLKVLTEINEVVSINKDRILKAHLRQGIPLINASTVRNTYNGQGVAIAICDTGIDYTHPKLGGGGFPNTKVIGGYDCGDNDNDPMDCNGHGTCCAGIAAGGLGSVGDYIGGVAYNAKLYAVKITHGSEGKAYDSDMIEAWEWCITHQNDDPNNPIMVISTSFGGGYYTSPCDWANPAMTEAAANAVDAGITLFASSGNEGYCDGTGWPACISYVNAVGAVYDANIGAKCGWCIDDDSCIGYSEPRCDPYGDPWACDDKTTSADLVTCYSNSATFLTLFAPSNNCYTTDIVGSGGYSPGDYYSSFGGTSAACPYAAGAAACLQSAAKAITGSFLTPLQVRTLLTSTGDRITDTKQGNISITKPRVNLEAAVRRLQGQPSLTWAKAYGGSGWDVARSIQQTSDGGYIVAGRTESFGGGAYDIWVIKLDKYGNIEWQKTYGGSDYDRPYSIQETTDGGYIVAGRTTLWWGYAWLLKLDKQGNISWQKAYGSSSIRWLSSASSVQETADGGYIVVGWVNPDPRVYYYHVWVLKLNADGNIVWQKMYNSERFGNDEAFSVQQTSDGGYIVAGAAHEWTNCDLIWLLKLNGDGDILSQKIGSYGYHGYSVRQTTDGGYVIAGNIYSFGAGESDSLLLKVDADGQIRNCGIIENSNAKVIETDATVYDTNAAINETTATVTNTNITPQDTNARVTVICGPSLNNLTPILELLLLSYLGFDGGGNIVR